MKYFICDGFIYAVKDYSKEGDVYALTGAMMYRLLPSDNGNLMGQKCKAL